MFTRNPLSLKYDAIAVRAVGVTPPIAETARV